MTYAGKSYYKEMLRSLKLSLKIKHIFTVLWHISKSPDELTKDIDLTPENSFSILGLHESLDIKKVIKMKQN